MSPGNAAAPGMGTEGERKDLATVTPDSTANRDSAELYEQADAGALLLATPQAARRVLDRLADSDIADPRCRFVVATVRRMVAEGTPVNAVTTAGFIERHNLLEPGPARRMLRSWLSELAGAAPVPDCLPYYADLVIEHAARRRIDAAGAELRRLAAGADIAELESVVRAELGALLEAIGRVSANV